MNKFIYFCLVFFICDDIFTFVSTAQDSLLYSKIVSFQELQTSTKSYLDTSIEFFSPEKSSFQNETVNTGFYNYIQYMYWLDNPILLNPQVSPQKGKPNDSFQFSVVYYDNDPPQSGYPKVRIYRDDVELIGSPFTLNYISGSLEEGITFSTSVVLSLPSDKYKFYFYVHDIYNFSTQTEYINGPVVDTPPQLSWDTEDGFKTDAVEPDFGTESTTFYFRVIYTDVDNHPPQQGFPKVYILKQDTTIQVLTLDYITGLYNTGALYSTKVSLPHGEYRYYLVAEDILGEQSNILSSTGPIVNSNCGIEIINYPKEIQPNENFIVYLKYKDISADPPAEGFPKIIFYLKDEVIHQDVMKYISGSFALGANYVYSVKFTTVSADYSFICVCMDNTGLWPLVCTNRNYFVVSTLPEKPIDITNYNHQKQNISVSSKITLKWYSQDPDLQSSITYELYFGDSVDNMKKIYEGTQTEYTVYNLDDNRTYYWYVVAIDDTGRKSQSKVYSFSTINVDNKDKVFNYPNPVNAKKGQQTNIVFYSEKEELAEIYICTAFGEIIHKDTIQVYKGSNVYKFKPDKEMKSGSYVVVIKISDKIKKGNILILNI
ncbi:MAG: hypothetical protein NZ839_01500 [Endomicrobia bacterium]|nr:hypothetical protein [Endomicrobiia bacterium]